MTLELVSEAVGLSHDGHLTSYPECAAQISSLSQDGKGVYSADLGDGCPQLVIFVVLKQLNSTILNLIALCD